MVWKPVDLGQVVTLNREEHRLVGLAPNRPKYPIVMERVRDGKVVLCTEDVIEKIHGSALAEAIMINAGQAAA